MKKLKSALGLFIFSLLVIFSIQVQAGSVWIDRNQLWVDGVAQPQLFGAEVQYFRLRGGYERNVPRAKVIELWSKALDRLVEAHMNAISFYIPWDFHEYAEGKFDFTGTVDEDGDGQPDYPSRDVVTFLKMIEERGITNIMVRPGPYINAEWGFLGFGAIPLWFHEKYPDSHMRNPQGLRTKMYDYFNPYFLRRTQIWFKTLYHQVLKTYMGPGRPIQFLQLDNETNFMWQSLYNHDYGPRAVARYQDFLKSRYSSLKDLNTAHQRTWGSWGEILPPVRSGENLAEDQDWYRFQDFSIYSYLQVLRRTWEDLGVREPNILFTLAESYNAPDQGVLPSYEYRNARNKTGMMTVNLYPKTYELDSKPLFNQPFKSDHDVKAAESATDAYLGKKEEWVMGPEIQGGWWRGINVSPEARRQTYLSTIGHGLKALFVYYYNEGDNWQTDWAVKEIRPMYEKLKNSSDEYRSLNDDQLPPAFWNQLQSLVDRKLVLGLDARSILRDDQKKLSELFFDAPLDGNAEPRQHYYDLKELGEKIVQPYGSFLGQAVELVDPVCLVKSSYQHAPSAVPGLNNVWMNSDWSGALLGYIMQTGLNPQIITWGSTSTPQDLQNCHWLILQDSGLIEKSLVLAIHDRLEHGAHVLNFLDDSLAKELGFGLEKSVLQVSNSVALQYKDQLLDARSAPLFHYQMGRDSNCRSLMSYNTLTVGYRCSVGMGEFVQVGAVLYDLFNSSAYSEMSDVELRRAFLEDLMSGYGFGPQVQVAEGADRLAVFARHIPGRPQMWITAKNGQKADVKFHILVRNLNSEKSYQVKNVLTGEVQTLSGKALITEGFSAELKEYGSTAYFLTELEK